MKILLLSKKELLIFQLECLRKSRIILTALLLVIVSSQTFGQVESSVSVDSEYLIKLNVEQSLVNIYLADISELNFDTEEAAKKIFDQFQIPALKVTVQWEEKIIKIEIFEDPIHIGYTVEDWNKYFSDKIKNIQK
jgi:hypothetical protein